MVAGVFPTSQTQPGKAGATQLVARRTEKLLADPARPAISLKNCKSLNSRALRTTGKVRHGDCPMRISIYSLIRLTALLSIVATTTGVAAHRLSPGSNQKWTLDHRQPWSVSHYFFNSFVQKNLMLDLATGREIRLQSEPGTKLDLVSVSPFSARSGEREIVCRQTTAKKPGQTHLPGTIDLVRISYPASKVIDRRTIDWLPNAPPAWDTRTDDGLRTIFATGAGQLIRVDWTDRRGLATGHCGSPIHWQIEPPFGENTFLSEPAWATAPELANHLLVSIWGKHPASGQYHAGLAAIELNHDRSAIVGCRMLNQRAFQKNTDSVIFRFPVSRTDTTTGRTRLAWQERVEGENGFSTFVADLGNNAQLENVRLVASGCTSAQAAFDDQLNHLYFVVSRSQDCYDGTYWRKARLTQPALVVASASRPASAHRPPR